MVFKTRLLVTGGAMSEWPTCQLGRSNLTTVLARIHVSGLEAAAEAAVRGAMS